LLQNIHAYSSLERSMNVPIGISLFYRANSSSPADSSALLKNKPLMLYHCKKRTPCVFINYLQIVAVLILTCMNIKGQKITGERDAFNKIFP